MEGNLARMTSKGQITIPKSIRDKINAKKGDYFLFSLKDDKVEVEKIALSPEDRFDRLAKKTREKFESLGIEDEEIEKAVEWAKKQGRQG